MSSDWSKIFINSLPNFQNFTEGNARKFTVSFAFCAHVDVIKYRNSFLNIRWNSLLLYKSMLPPHGWLLESKSFCKWSTGILSDTANCFHFMTHYYVCHLYLSLLIKFSGLINFEGKFLVVHSCYVMKILWILF